MDVILKRLDVVKGLKREGYVICSRCGYDSPFKLREDGLKEYAMERPCVKCGCLAKNVLPLYENSKFTVQVLDELATAYRFEIHQYLVPFKTEEAELAVRSHVRDILSYCLPIVEERVVAFREKYRQAQAVYNGLVAKGIQEGEKLEACYARMAECNKWYKQYKELKERFQALAAFRHFETFCLYIDSLFENDVFTPSLHLFKGFYYYANSMVLNRDVRFISKQCFTGAGKSVTDCALIAFILGYNINNDILKVFGSKDNIQRAMDTIVMIMTSSRYAEVFPYFRQFASDRGQMFDMLKSSGEMKIAGSGKPVNLTIRSKEMSFDGIRAKYLFLDDITKSADAERVSAHESDIYAYTSCWSQRRYNANEQFVIASGTTYHVKDILSYLRDIFGAETATPAKFRFTSVSKSDEIVTGGVSVFVKIYGLDEKDESTYPAKFPTNAFRLLREKNPRSFAAMTQQEPMPPEGCPFDMQNLPLLYSEIPHENREEEVCYATLDSARKGFDFQSMPIMIKIAGEWYLKDCLFKQTPTDKIIPMVVEKVIQHRIVELNVENNIDTSIAALLRKRLSESGVTWCKVTETFSTKNKVDKIMDNETAIKTIHFPAEGVFGKASDMGKFMYWLNAYNYERPPLHDDSVDSLANFCTRFIVGKKAAPTVKILNRRK